MLLQIRCGEFRYGDVVIFSDVNLDVKEGENIGIVGANGAGKSTLLSCIVGDNKLFNGTITKKAGLSIGVLKQKCDFVSSNTLYQELLSVFSEQQKLVDEINCTAEKMSSCSSDEYKKLSDKYHRLIVQADVDEAYSCEQKVQTVISGMGMSEFSNRIVATLSGGEKTKAALCKLLLLKPELLILDEPTNHLDYKTLDWLENYLSDKKSTLIVVSHDRYFLDKLCSTIWDVENKKVISYNGNYSKYKNLKTERLLNQSREYEKQQKEIEKLQDYIARNKVRASTADMAKSREKALEKMKIVEKPYVEEKPPHFLFSYTSEPSEVPLQIRDFSVSFGDKQVLNHASLEVRRGQKIALLGLNGSGKSTLIKRIASQNAYDFSHIITGKNVRLGYYDQENVNLDGKLTVLEQLWFDNTRMSQTDVRSLLAQVNLGADDVYKSVDSLSGGERAKLGLAMIMAKDCNVLLLDEPTNHLDLQSRESLEDALKLYTGTVLFVSHDRYFVNAISTQIAELENGKINCYEGNYENFSQRKNSNATVKVKVPQNSYRNAKQRAEQTNRNKKIKECEERITELEKQIEFLNNQLILPQVISDFIKAKEISTKLDVANRNLEEALTEWEVLCGEEANK